MTEGGGLKECFNEKKKPSKEKQLNNHVAGVKRMDRFFS